MYTIAKEFTFSASHELRGLPDGHPCSRTHGHNYVVTVELKARTLDGTGFVFDYRKLDPIKKFIDSKLDHQHLNNAIPFNPTAENIAKFLFDYCVELLEDSSPDVFMSAVSVSETPKTTARYDLS
jgi:6-pyruvoyltetrahydropterin/6-carboxytetrahydropterin synthase